VVEVEVALYGALAKEKDAPLPKKSVASNHQKPLAYDFFRIL
jgi:hypothetical protein